MKRLKTGIILCAVLISAVAAGAVFCLVSSQTKATPPADKKPCETVTTFFEAVERRDYGSYADCLYECSSLGLENEPEDGTEKLLWEKLRASFAHEIKGEAETDYDRARVRVKLTGFSLKRASVDVRRKTQNYIAETMQNPSLDDVIFDDSGNYCEDFIMERYEKAVADVAENSDKYRSSTEITVELVYIEGKWRIVVTDELSEALTGSRFK